MVILHIETSTSVCSVAASENGVLLSQKINMEGMNHARLLSVFIAEVMEQLAAMSKKIDAVALSRGPGSYTGIRIGTATAKGLCFGYDVPLIAIDTLQIIATSALSKIENLQPTDLLCPMIDARRMEVYDEIFSTNLSSVEAVKADIIDENSFSGQLDKHKIFFFGDGSEKCKTVITHPNAVFVEKVFPEAQFMIALAEAKYAAQKFEDIAYFDPLYLKEFQATTPKKKLF